MLPSAYVDVRCLRRRWVEAGKLRRKREKKKPKWQKVGGWPNPGSRRIPRFPRTKYGKCETAGEEEIILSGKTSGGVGKLRLPSASAEVRRLPRYAWPDDVELGGHRGWRGV